MPPADALLLLSEIFDVTINELLSGRRLTESEYVAAAEKNLTKAIKQSSFTLKERIEFFKKKWLKEHIAIMCFLGIVIVSAYALGLYLKNYLLLCASILMLFVAHCWRNNTMMTYVEKNAFDETSE